jgi:hypothetical protein
MEWAYGVFGCLGVCVFGCLGVPDIFLNCSPQDLIWIKEFQVSSSLIVMQQYNHQGIALEGVIL